MKLFKNISTVNKASKLQDGTPAMYLLLLIAILELAKTVTGNVGDEKIDKIIKWLKSLGTISLADIDAAQSKFDELNKQA